MELKQIFSPSSIILNLESTDKDELFEEMVEAVHTFKPEIKREEALTSIRERESKMSTGIMHDVAVPHGSCSSVDGVVGAIGISRKGIDYDALDKAPVHFVFLLLSNVEETEKHLSALKLLASVLQSPEFIKEIFVKETPQDVYNVLCEYESKIDN